MKDLGQPISNFPANVTQFFSPVEAIVVLQLLYFHLSLLTVDGVVVVENLFSCCVDISQSTQHNTTQHNTHT